MHVLSFHGITQFETVNPDETHENPNFNGLANKLLNSLRNTLTRFEEPCLHLKMSVDRLNQTHRHYDTESWTR